MKSSRRLPVVQRAAASLMLSLWLGTVALAVFPELHHFLHQDSQSTTHQCLATLLTKSHLLGGWAGDVTIVLSLLIIGWLLFTEISRFSAVDYRLSPSRAPPATFS